MALTKIDDRGLKTPVDLLDNEKIRFGTGNDLEIYHDGSNSIISDAGTGGLEIQSNGTGIYLQKSASEYLAKFLTDGAVELYNDNVKQVATTSTGLLMTGNAHGIELKSASANSGNFIKFSDHDTSDDGRIQYEHSTNEFLFKAEGSWRTRLGTTYLKPETTNVFDLGTDSQRFKDVYVSNDIDLLDNSKLLIGTGDDLEIYHDGSNSVIRNVGTGDLFVESISGTKDTYIRGSRSVFIQSNSNENHAKFIQNGATELYFDGALKAQTTSTGFINYGNLHMNGDNRKVILGGGDDLQIYHDGTDSYINSRTGNLYLAPTTGTENGITVVPNGEIRLYHDNSKKFETTSSGVLVSGNVDAGTGNFLTDDNGKYFAGTGGDLSIYHNGSDSFIDNATGAVLIRNLSGDDLVLQTVSAENNIKCKPNSQVELYFDNSEKIRTTSTGFKTLGNAQFDDSRKVVFGDGTDLEIFHDGTDSIIRNLTGQTRIQAANIFRVTNYGASETYIKGSLNGSTELYYDDVKHIETTSIGAKISDNDSTTALQFNTSSGDNGYVFADGTDTIGFKDNNPHWMVECTKGGRVLLLHNGNGKLETASWGVGITGNCSPTASNTHDLGSSSARWNNLYVNDMHFSNHPDNPNSVDGTWGDWTLQEGENDIFMLNNRTGKKYKMALQEVS